MKPSDSENNQQLTTETGTVIENRWQALRKYTDARIGIGRAGNSQPTSARLQFQLAHACAQDAVNKPPDWMVIEAPLKALNIPLHRLSTRVPDRLTYLQRPDLGRRLHSESAALLKQWREQYNDAVDVCIVIADGLSATAIEQQALPMVTQLLQALDTSKHCCSALCLLSQGRVAAGDEIAQLLRAEFMVMLIGERPGLSAADSLGIYFTYRAHIGCSDAQRNCISNIRPRGLSFAQASERLLWLINEAERLQLSGVQLKDDSQTSDALSSHNRTTGAGNFLVEKP
jgi:ethanolamine ammonia-lyase small subunit